MIVAALVNVVGSSPRMRGTRFEVQAPEVGRRFIPAHAGNTGSSDG
ncbi:protein of unknown function [Denitratisoma oestradiolicum]|uniref:Uncharacterized protein n=1 Tax=Denitratisoma oestradiolicum TaxID=311182 RepID=A0A6S6YK05_9PROT|nr:protein of unknown function [Denitratisoma oestradiolicum]